MLKMVMFIYNEAMDQEAMQILQENNAKNFTKITQVFGRGDASGYHLGTDIWPGRNNVLFIACEDPVARKILDGVRALRKKLGHEGTKAFLIPLEAVT